MQRAGRKQSHGFLSGQRNKILKSKIHFLSLKPSIVALKPSPSIVASAATFTTTSFGKNEEKISFKYQEFGKFIVENIQEKSVEKFTVQ